MKVEIDKPQTVKQTTSQYFTVHKKVRMIIRFKYSYRGLYINIAIIYTLWSYNHEITCLGCWISG